MKLASAVLKPAESKKLIAKAVCAMPEVQRALKEGYLVIHPCSTNLFLYEEIAGERPEGAWVFGYVGPEGCARSLEARRSIELEKQGVPARKQWVFYQGRLQEAAPLDHVLAAMKEGDVFVKGANALDSEGNVAMLTPNPVKGGTTGKLCQTAPVNGFTVVIPVGLEKLIPGRLDDVFAAIGQHNPEDAMGLRCGLVRGQGIKIDERDALWMLTGVEAVMGAGGGIDGAEGAVTLFLRGTDEQVDTAMVLLRSLKGAELPKLTRE